MGRFKAGNIKRECYTMSETGKDEIEILMYGEIVQERPKNYWTNETIEGNFIVLDEFLEDLDSFSKAKKLTIRINSIGGDAYAAIPIHNRLREIKAEKEVIVDGVAMSGGSLIMCAADTVKVNESSLIMIHNCWSFIFGGFNAEDLRKMAASNEAVDKAQAAIYKRKTGLSEEEILSLMADETYLTGKEAVEKGFADEVLDSEPVLIAASANLNSLYVNGKEFKMANPIYSLPDSIPTHEEFSSNEKLTEKTSDNLNKNTQGGDILAKNLEELRTENPELAEVITGDINAAVSAERNRIAEIDKIAVLYDDEIVSEAKFGETACTAQELAFRAAQNAAKQGKKALSDMQADANASNASEITAIPPKEDEKKTLTYDELMAQGRADAQKAQGKEVK